MKMRPLWMCLMTLFLASAAFGQDMVGDWVVDVSAGDDFTYAATSNDTGRLLAQFCYFNTGNCIWTLTMSTECDENVTYPVLVGAEKVAESMRIICVGQITGPGQYSYAFSDFDQIERVLRTTGRIGFAMAVEGDEFQVIRFDTKSAAAAALKAADLAAKRSKVPTRNTNTRDRRL